MIKFKKTWSILTIVVSCYIPCTAQSKAFRFAYLNPVEIDSFFRDCYNGINREDCDRASNELSFIGEYAELVRLNNITHQKTYATIIDSTLSLHEYELRPAYPYILEQAKKNQVVMFNESHHLPYHRIFVYSFLEDFKRLGFKYLGVEGISKESGETLMQRGRPTLQTGHLIKEPQYANLIRKALELGFIVFDYDRKWSGGGKAREINQARAIASVLEKDPTAKIVIHSGEGHIREDTRILEGLMGYEFRKLTGINPFTINQSRCNPQSKREYEHLLYRQLDGYEVPSLLFHKNTNQTFTDSITDIIVFHPRINMDAGNRPAYLAQYQLTEKKMKIPKQIQAYPLLIAAYLVNETGDYELEIPVDLAFVSAKLNRRRSLSLFFPFKGDYKIFIFDKNKAMVWESVLKISD